MTESTLSMWNAKAACADRTTRDAMIIYEGASPIVIMRPWIRISEPLRHHNILLEDYGMMTILMSVADYAQGNDGAYGEIRANWLGISAATGYHRTSINRKLRSLSREGYIIFDPTARRNQAAIRIPDVNKLTGDQIFKMHKTLTLSFITRIDPINKVFNIKNTDTRTLVFDRTGQADNTLHGAQLSVPEQSAPQPGASCSTTGTTPQNQNGQKCLEQNAPQNLGASQDAPKQAKSVLEQNAPKQPDSHSLLLEGVSHIMSNSGHSCPSEAPSDFGAKRSGSGMGGVDGAWAREEEYSVGTGSTGLTSLTGLTGNTSPLADALLNPLDGSVVGGGQSLSGAVPLPGVSGPGPGPVAPWSFRPIPTIRTFQEHEYSSRDWQRFVYRGGRLDEIEVRSMTAERMGTVQSYETILGIPFCKADLPFMKESLRFTGYKKVFEAIKDAAIWPPDAPGSHVVAKGFEAILNNIKACAKFWPHRKKKVESGFDASTAREARARKAKTVKPKPAPGPIPEVKP